MSKEKIDDLAAQIVEHRRLYYNHTPTISDAAFDALCKKLRRIDPNNPALTDVGHPVEISEWKKADHEIPMGSLDKVNTPDEIARWILETFKPTNSIFITEKLDGISIELIYNQGKLIQAITRGDGFVGEDIVANVSKMGGVKKVLPIKFTGSLRGEIILKKSNLKKYFEDASNARNAAGGVAKRLDGEGCEYLNVLLYQVLGDVDFTSEHLQFKFLQDELGLEVPYYEGYAGKDVNSLITFVVNKWSEYQKDIRDTLDYDIDGLVVRVNDLEAQIMLGDKDMRPKGAMAFKFDSEDTLTKILDILCQTGNSGRITPVGLVESVHIMGANVSRASLYNFAYIQALGVDVGAEVIICRANDVIPRIKSVIKGTDTIFQIPTKCPACDGSVKMDGENLMCINTDTCPAQKVGRIKNWIKTINILEWGNTLLGRLVETNKVITVADLYKLSVEDLSSIERMGEKSANKCHEILWSHNPIPLELFLGGLSIPMIGGSMINMVMNAGYTTLDKILAASKEEFAAIKGMGPAKSETLFNGLRRNKKLIEELLSAGFKTKGKAVGKFTNKSFCFTGTMRTNRKELQNMVVENGGDAKSSVGKGLTYLVIADVNSVSSKAIAAKKLGTKLISEDDFLSMVK
jgi:DNA ligase (NAD+)